GNHKLISSAKIGMINSRVAVTQPMSILAPWMACNDNDAPTQIKPNGSALAPKRLKVMPTGPGMLSPVAFQANPASVDKMSGFFRTADNTRLLLFCAKV